MNVRERDVILKKRCIGRRKWTDESTADDGSWVYNAAVSLAEAVRPTYAIPTAVHAPGKPMSKMNLLSMLQTAKLATGDVLEEPALRKLDTQVEFQDTKNSGRRGEYGLVETLTFKEARHSRKHPFTL